MRHWRLSIVDLSDAANQPLCDENYALAFNGEIYDYENIANRYFGKTYRSDTQLLFDMITSGNVEKIENSSGFFSFVMIDKQNMRVSGARDFWGKKPLYYYIDDEFAIFASEETAIAALTKMKSGLCSRAMLRYAVYKNFHFGETCFTGVKELPPGGEFSFDVNRWELCTSPDWDAYYKTSLRSVVVPELLDLPIFDVGSDRNDIIEHVRHAVRLRYQCDVPVQLALSGGVDSAAIAAMTAHDPRLRERLMRAITVQFSHDKDESAKAKRIADELGFEHTIVPFEDYDLLDLLCKAVRMQGGPLEHPHSLAYYILCKEARCRGKVLITGEGADELLFGYSHYKGEFHESFAFRRFLDLDDMFDGPSIPALFFEKEQELRGCALVDPICSQDLEMKTHLCSLLRRNDRMSMASSVEIRAPYLDIGLFYRLCASGARASERDGKGFLSDFVAERVPSFSRDLTKIGFHVPFDLWFDRNRDKERVRALTDTALCFFQSEYDLHLRSGVKIEGRLAWILCNVGTFLNQFFP